MTLLCFVTLISLSNTTIAYHDCAPPPVPVILEPDKGPGPSAKDCNKDPMLKGCERG